MKKLIRKKFFMKVQMIQLVLEIYKELLNQACSKNKDDQEDKLNITPSQAKRYWKNYFNFK